MSLCLRLVVMLVVSSVVLSPVAGFEEELQYKFYIVSLKDSYAKKKYKVRAFFLDTSFNSAVYGIPKMPDGWHYHLNDERTYEFVAAAYTDNDAVDISFFKDFLSFILDPYSVEEGLFFSMTMICLKQDGTTKILLLDAKDFKIKEIHKHLKLYHW